jgi:hypothetical protein
VSGWREIFVSTIGGGGLASQAPCGPAHTRCARNARRKCGAPTRRIFGAFYQAFSAVREVPEVQSHRIPRSLTSGCAQSWRMSRRPLGCCGCEASTHAKISIRTQERIEKVTGGRLREASGAWPLTGRSSRYCRSPMTLARRRARERAPDPARLGSLARRARRIPRHLRGTPCRRKANGELVVHAGRTPSPGVTASVVRIELWQSLHPLRRRSRCSASR